MKRIQTILFLGCVMAVCMSSIACSWVGTSTQLKRYVGIWTHDIPGRDPNESTVVLEIKLEKGRLVTRYIEQYFSYKPVLTHSRLSEGKLDLQFKMVSYENPSMISPYTIQYLLQERNGVLKGQMRQSREKPFPVVLKKFPNDRPVPTDMASTCLFPNAPERNSFLANVQHSVRVVDSKGRPVRKLQIEGAVACGEIGLASNGRELTRANALPDPTNKTIETYISDSGLYCLPQWQWNSGVWISSEKSARELFIYPPSPSKEPAEIVLYPSSKITLSVLDHEGHPLGNASVIPEGESVAYFERGGSTGYWVPKTNADGKLVFDKVSPGLHAWRIYKSGEQCNLLAAFKVKPGRAYAKTVRLGTPPKRTR